ncbi:MAG: hypothetical protein V7K89_14235, partial [Nostoc sp.]|uniref:response regulator n=1 Tax=Nostoc sp. TaxID=1180 RepID=UPI003037E013
QINQTNYCIYCPKAIYFRGTICSQLLENWYNFRQYTNLAKIPVVILTSRSTEKHRQLAKELGAKAYLTKPFLEHELISKIQELMNSNADDLEHLVMVKNNS